ncbi:MAG: thioredoxin family protein [Labilithrix sp.]|nr:thioredoxin family protein [Labilithrix sp.]MCW5833497.1 thioredoxin family protein [Labilithrix sp.]
MGSVRLPRPFALFVLLALSGLGCSRAESATTGPEPAASADRARPASGGAGPSAPLVLARGIRFVKAGGGDVPSLVRAERERATADGRDLIVYVGAKWCEPCQRFHQAAQRGELDAEFPELTILEFDLDEDRDRINAAGYSSKLIPLFVRPGEDGRGSDRRFEGGVKGERAVANITPRLRKLLDK